MFYSSEVVEYVKSSIPLINFFEGSKKIKNSHGYLVLCPFHDDKNPSLSIDIKFNRYRCFACQESGDVISFVMKSHSLNFVQSIKYLIEQHGIQHPDLENKTYKNNTQDPIYKVFLSIQKIYSTALEKNILGLNYLVEDRCLSIETIKKFGLGIVTKGIHSFLKHDNNDLVRIGFLSQTEQNYYERMKMMITIPLYSKGKLIGFSGRALPNTKHTVKYLNPPSTDFFQKNEFIYALDLARTSINHSKKIVICEGYFDVMALHQIGETTAVSCLGTAFTDQQIDTVLQLSQKIYLYFDEDNAGRKATDKTIEKLLPKMHDSHEIYILNLECDAADYLKKGLDFAVWEQQLNQAITLTQYFTQQFSLALASDDRVELILEIKNRLLSMSQASLLRQLISREIQYEFNIDLGI